MNRPPLIIAPSWISSLPVSMGARVLLFDLWGWVSDREDPFVWPSRKLLAESLGCSARHIDKLLSELYDSGAVRKVTRYRGGRRIQGRALAKALPDSAVEVEHEPDPINRSGPDPIDRSPQGELFVSEDPINRSGLTDKRTEKRTENENRLAKSARMREIWDMWAEARVRHGLVKRKGSPTEIHRGLIWSRDMASWPTVIRRAEEAMKRQAAEARIAVADTPGARYFTLTTLARPKNFQRYLDAAYLDRPPLDEQRAAPRSLDDDPLAVVRGTR